MSLLDTASLIVTPNGYKEGKLYSVIPSDGAGDLSVTRATTATRVNSAGLVELVPYNLLQQSENFTSTWTQVNSISVTGNTATAPNGTLTADTLQAGATISVVRQGASSSPASTYTFSVWLKKASGTPTTRLRIEDNAAPYNSTFVNVTPTNEWVRYEVTRTIGAGITDIVADIFPDYVNGTGSVYAWGAQLVEGSTAKDYQKTETRLNIPRLDYSNGTCPSLLVEPQRTNVALQSSSFDNAAWTAQAVSLSANATTAPDGTTTADKIILANGSQFDPVVYQILDTTANTRTLTFFAKAAEYNIAFGRVGGSTSTPIVLFQLSGSGSILHNQNVSAYSIEPLENGWYRCSMTYAHGTVFAPNVGVCSATYSVTSSSVISTGNGTSGIFIWGAQVEVGSYATSYIPTTSASVTRNADVISKTGISSLIGQTEGTLFCDFEWNGQTSSTIVSLSDGTEDNNIMVYILSVGTIRVYSTALGVYDFYDTSVTASIGTRYKLAVAYANNDLKVYINGSSVASSTSVSIPATSQFTIGSAGNFNYKTAAEYNAAALWKTRLTNTQLAQLTTI